VSEETERATVGGASDREKEQEESAKKPNAFESEESERATVGDNSDEGKRVRCRKRRKEQQSEVKATERKSKKSRKRVEQKANEREQ
jgi:hypothetical protein